MCICLCTQRYTYGVFNLVFPWNVQFSKTPCCDSGTIVVEGTGSKTSS